MSDEIKNDENLDEDINSAEDNSELHEIMYGADYKEYEYSLGKDDDEEEEELPKHNLSTFYSENEEAKSQKPKKTHIKKQTVIIISLSAAFAVILALFLILGPVGFDVFGFKEVTEAPLELVEGEAMIGTKKRLMFTHVPRENLQRLTVNNEHGGFVLYYNKEYEDFLFEGAENAVYNNELLSSLITYSGYTMISDRLSHDERAEDYSEYGLGKDDTPLNYEILTKDGTTHKIYVGSVTLDESGYYVMYEGRDEIYVISSSMFSVLFNDLKSFLTPILTYPISGNDYFTEITDVYIQRDNNPFVQLKSVKNASADEATGITTAYEISYPKYFPASTSQVQDLYSQIVNLTGEEILEYGISEITGTDENGENIYELRDGIAEKYGFDAPAYEIWYLYTENKLVSNVFFSKKQVDGDGNEFYYAASILYDTIVKLDASKVSFLEWEVSDYIERTVFNYNINYVKSIEIKEQIGDKREFNFVLSGTGNSLSVIEKVSNTILKANPEGTPDDVFDNMYNFRKFYMTSLTITTEDFVQEPENKVFSMEVTVTLRSGEAINYKFYNYSERHCYYTINDEGEFYISRAMATKFINDAGRVINGESVDYNAES